MRVRNLLIVAAVCLLSAGAAMSQPCGVTPSSNASNFNGTPIHGGSYIWFNANFKAQGIPAAGATIYLTSSRISFTADQPYVVATPNAEITFDPDAACASTTFDTLNDTWRTVVPVSGSDEIFLSGVAFPVPDSFANSGGLVVGPVVWEASFGSNTDGITVSWKWGAAVYTSFSTDYNLLGIKPAHTKSCLYENADHAGTPEGVNPLTGVPFKKSVKGGARGGGGSNWTGSWSGTVTVPLTCTEVPPS